MKKLILKGALLATLIGTLALQSCNNENKAEPTDSTTLDSLAMDTNQITPIDTLPIDTGMKGTKVPTPK